MGHCITSVSYTHLSASIKPDEKGKTQSGCLFSAGTQGIAALAAQGGVALSLIHISLLGGYGGAAGGVVIIFPVLPVRFARP